MAQLRIWKIGSLEHKIFPTQAGIQKLRQKLMEWDGKSDFDLIWGPELTVEVYQLDGNCDVDRIIAIKPEEPGLYTTVNVPDKFPHWD